MEKAARMPECEDRRKMKRKEKERDRYIKEQKEQEERKYKGNKKGRTRKKVRRGHHYLCYHFSTILEMFSGNQLIIFKVVMKIYKPRHKSTHFVLVRTVKMKEKTCFTHQSKIKLLAPSEKDAARLSNDVSVYDPISYLLFPAAQMCSSLPPS